MREVAAQVVTCSCARDVVVRSTRSLCKGCGCGIDPRPVHACEGNSLEFFQPKEPQNDVVSGVWGRLCNRGQARHVARCMPPILSCSPSCCVLLYLSQILAILSAKTERKKGEVKEKEEVSASSENGRKREEIGEKSRDFGMILCLMYPDKQVKLLEVLYI